MANADRLIELFNEAKARPAGVERERFLAEACPGEAELKEQVSSLLQAHEGAGQFLLNTRDGPATAQVTEKPGDRIGHYKLLQQLGEGGGGVVYMAEQTEPVRRKVALKVIKLGMDTRHVVARFEAERQALALMDHPNIATVFDAGATDLGRIYFVMELVKGIKITDYCDQNQLSITERLDLFIQVCQAIQHAHQKGIIHRDIKPSNILVAQLDAVAVPKVIDFGIAKATSDQPLTDKTLFTAFEQFMGTPAYMSPEQAQLSGLDIDTRTDIYSLGVLLYELLTGQPPFDPEELMKSGLDEMRRTIREKEPVRPSTRLTMELIATRQARSSSSPPAARGEARRLHPAQKELIALLRGDLDWIVMKCLEKERTRRYETANGLAADLKRHLGHEPVVARPPSRTYRFQKLVRRNKLAFAAASVITIALMAGFLGVLWQSVARQKALAETRRLLYATDMNSALQALESMNLGRAVELLDRHRPIPGQPDLRGFEWRYLWGLCQGDERATLRGHTNTVTGVAFSPDGRLLASGSKDKTIRLWDVASQRLLRVLPESSGAIWSVAFSAVGSQLIAAGDSGVMFWDTRDWTVQRNLSGEFHSAVFTRDVQTIVAANNAGVTVLATARGTGPFPLPDTSWPAVFSPDEQRLATLSRGGIKIWNVSSLSSNASPLRTIPWTDFRHSAEHELAFSPDGQIITTGDNDGRVMLFDPRSGRNLAAFDHMGRIDTLTFSPDGKILASASADQTVKLWDVAGKTNLATLRGHGNAVWSAAFSPDGQTLATGSKDHTVKLWQAGPRHSTDDLQLPGLHFRMGADGATVAHWDRGVCVQFFDVATKQVTDSLAVPADLRNWNLARSERTMTIITRGGLVHCWNLAAKTRSSQFQISPEYFDWTVQIAPDGSELAMTGSGPDGNVRVWSLPDGREHRCFRRAGQLVALLDGVMATQISEGTLRLSDFKTGRAIATFEGHQGAVLRVALSPDGQILATASWDHTARLWEAATGRLIGVLRGHKEGLMAIDFSPDGRTLATGSDDDTVKLWNVATQQEILTLRPRHSDIKLLRFTPDGTRLIAASLPGVVNVWRAPDFNETDALSSR